MSSTIVQPGRSSLMRRAVLAAVASIALIAASLVPSSPAHAVTTGNGALVYSPAAGSSFNPEGGTPADTRKGCHRERSPTPNIGRSGLAAGS